MRLGEIWAQRVQTKTAGAGNYTKFALVLPMRIEFCGESVRAALAEYPAEMFGHQIARRQAAFYRCTQQDDPAGGNLRTGFEHAQDYQAAKTVTDEVQCFYLQAAYVIRKPLSIDAHWLQYGVVMELMRFKSGLGHAQA